MTADAKPYTTAEMEALPERIPAGWVLVKADKLLATTQALEQAERKRAESIAKLGTQLIAARATIAELVGALEDVGHASSDGSGRCWCALDCMVPYRGHDGGCEAAREALARAKGGG